MSSMRATKLSKLQELLAVAKFKHASFSHDGKNITELVKSATEVYRETWLIPYIEEMIAEEEAKREKRRR